MNDFFAIPINNQFLVYAPLYRMAQVVDHSTFEKLQQLFSGSSSVKKKDLLPIIPQLKNKTKERIQTLHGPVNAPLFLGLITTRGCNMGCHYCDFPAPKSTSPHMTMELAKKSIDMYLSILSGSGIKKGQIEFFGGEPFFQNRIAEFALSYGKHRADRLGIELQFKVTTNGIMSREKCEWVADRFDTAVLSLDGPARFQNENRPLPTGADSFDIVYRSASILSKGNVDLILRSCITQASVEQMPDIARWFTQKFAVDQICFEPLTPSEFSKKHGILPPDPRLFALNYLQAQDILDSSGIGIMTSGSDIDALQYSFCPLGKDALIVTPEGNINACYLLEINWENIGLDLKIGTMTEELPFFKINNKRLIYERSFNQIRAPLCKTCFAKYHCAGGCHINHAQIQQAVSYDRLCIQTRIIILGKLLKRIKAYPLYNNWLETVAKSSQNDYQPSEIML